ncbi:MAG: DUF1007 family protein [Aestuariivirgaceae bacterium]|nr:DUF1007 family protein [Aestuariivirgaceae bacterium]
MNRIILGLIFTLASLPANAHPHVWITATSAAILDASGQVTGIRNTWTMDEDYSTMATEGLDTDGDGKFTNAELEPLSRENLEALKESEFFTFAYADDVKLPQGTPGNAHQVMENGKLTLTFDVPLAKPVDPKKQAFKYQVYDPSFYIEITVEKAELAGTPPAACQSESTQADQSGDIFATKTMLADKPPDWQPPIEQDFGALFADTVKITCAS